MVTLLNSEPTHYPLEHNTSKSHTLTHTHTQTQTHTMTHKLRHTHTHTQRHTGWLSRKPSSDKVQSGNVGTDCGDHRRVSLERVV